MKLPAPLRALLENEYVKLIRETFSEWSKDKASRLAAALAYFTLFSMAPLLVIVIFIAGLVFGEAAARGQLVQQIEGVVGSGSAEMIQTMIANTAQSTSGGIIATVVGIATLLLGAAGLFGALEDSLNTVWNIKPQKKTLVGTIKDRALSFGMVLVVGFLLLVTLVISAALAGFASLLNDILPGSAWVLIIGNFFLSFAVIAVLFAAIYKVLPDKEIAWRDVWVGGATTALLFVIGKELIGFYLGRSAVGSAYGAAASLVVLLVWLYYSAQILLFGAEFTKVWARKYGSERDKAPAEARETAPIERPARFAEPAADTQPGTARPIRGETRPAGIARYIGVALGVAFGWMLAKTRS